MKRFVLLLVVALVTNAIGVQAQEEPSRFTKQHMKRIVQSLAEALTHESAGVQLSAAQAIRQLEWEFPQEPMTELLDPLINIVKDENSDTRVRILSVIALDGLHSDMGDKVIENVSKLTKNKSMVDLCEALIVKNDKFR
jgi:HEAT repeat protein